MARRDVEHHLKHDLLQYGPQPSGSGLALQRIVGDGLERLLLDDELHVVHLEQALVLLDQGVARLGQDAQQRFFVEAVQRHDDRHAANELRYQAELQQVFGEDVLEYLADVLFFLGLDFRAETHGLLAGAVLDDLFDAVEGSAADEQDVGRVDLDELLMRVLAAALRRHAGSGAFQYLQQRLLHALAGHVPCDGRVFRLAGYFVYLVDIDDALFGLLHIIIGCLN